YGMSALTAVVAENTVGVQRVVELEPAFVLEQIASAWDDVGVDALKTGMLANAAIVEAVAADLARRRARHLVVDPVMLAKGGEPLLAPDARRALTERLLPLAEVVTPNLPEAEALSGIRIAGEEDRREAARRIQALSGGWVVVKGGHAPWQPDRSVDLAYDGRDWLELEGERVETPHTHGTGCTFSAAIAAGLARGLDVPAALRLAKAFITAAIRGGARRPLGHGHGPTDPVAAARELGGIPPEVPPEAMEGAGGVPGGARP
ncbi:MAG: bifunctional hydroxymethylpyrimidine kinase/phosphomethylpyrimidine kinase, partial [Bacillota bacterium]|nr:bifunctional hydroxymethylpyrimidine kinase/phosphomethylpyrimidine kinase [Bacillota bacterium]